MGEAAGSVGLFGRNQKRMRLIFLPIDSPARPRYAGLNMVGNRPVVGVRNPLGSFSPPSFLRAKNAGITPPGTEPGGKLYPGVTNQRVSPVRLLEAAPQS
jgi:hypothetical protein